MIKIRSGQIPKGVVKISGAKNSATRLMAAATLSDEKTCLSNFPTELVDVAVKKDFLEAVGAEIELVRDEEKAIVSANNLHCVELDSYDYPIRTTYLLVACQLVRSGRAKIPYPGGCKIGNRKYDLHLLVWEKFGCKVIEQDAFIEVIAPVGGIIGAEIIFPITTVGGTENALLCASVAKGTTTINNAYISPEVQDLINMLCLMGVEIDLHGKGCIVINGQKELRGVNYSVMPDRIEAITWIVYGILSGGEILIEDVPFDNMNIPLTHLQDAGINFFKNSNSIYISHKCLDEYSIQPFEVACGTHPGVISDMQPFYVLLALKAKGKSKIIDYRYPERTAFIDELNKFTSTPIHYNRHGYITVDGPVQLHAAEAHSTDLRGSMAVIMTALLVEDGESIIHGPEMAFRGYNKLIEKFDELGIKLIKNV
jgi:UDP-N-acetylglucosamine 1-carboxyvinyltransferase